MAARLAARRAVAPRTVRRRPASSRARAGRRVAARALVNVDFNAGTILGVGLVGAGFALYQVRSVRPQLSRDYDVFFASVSLLCGGILIFQGWRLDPILLFGQLLTATAAVSFAVEAVRLRAIVAQREPAGRFAEPRRDTWGAGYADEEDDAAGWAEGRAYDPYDAPPRRAARPGAGDGGGGSWGYGGEDDRWGGGGGGGGGSGTWREPPGGGGGGYAQREYEDDGAYGGFRNAFEDARGQQQPPPPPPTRRPSPPPPPPSRQEPRPPRGLEFDRRVPEAGDAWSRRVESDWD